MVNKFYMNIKFEKTENLKLGTIVNEVDDNLANLKDMLNK